MDCTLFIVRWLNSVHIHRRAFSSVHVLLQMGIDLLTEESKYTSHPRMEGKWLSCVWREVSNCHFLLIWYLHFSRSLHIITVLNSPSKCCSLQDNHWQFFIISLMYNRPDLSLFIILKFVFFFISFIGLNSQLTNLIWLAKYFLIDFLPCYSKILPLLVKILPLLVKIPIFDYCVFHSWLDFCVNKI